MHLPFGYEIRKRTGKREVFPKRPNVGALASSQDNNTAPPSTLQHGDMEAATGAMAGGGGFPGAIGGDGQGPANGLSGNPAVHPPQMAPVTHGHLPPGPGQWSGNSSSAPALRSMSMGPEAATGLTTVTSPPVFPGPTPPVLPAAAEVHDSALTSPQESRRRWRRRWRDQRSVSSSSSSSEASWMGAPQVHRHPQVVYVYHFFPPTVTWPGVPYAFYHSFQPQSYCWYCG